jgi:hypothetical protein
MNAGILYLARNGGYVKLHQETYVPPERLKLFCPNYYNYIMNNMKLISKRSDGKKETVPTQYVHLHNIMKLVSEILMT